jgi:hypothetical protein
MKNSIWRVCLVIGLALFSVAQVSAQINAIQNADVKNYFAANSENLVTSQQADPIAIPLWGGSAGLGPYPITGPSNVPAVTPLPVFPGTLTPANSFSGGTYSTTFADIPTGTVSTSWITANAPGGFNVADGNAQIDFFLANPTTTYAYQQVNFSLDYLALAPLGGGIAGAPTFIVNGFTTGPGSYAQVAGIANYYWTDINSAGIVGATTPLGSLQYNWSQIGPGAFTNVPVTPNTSSSLLPTPGGSTGGVLSIVGEFFVAGDPAEISVVTVPEPSTWTTLGLGASMFALLRRRRA